MKSDTSDDAEKTKTSVKDGKEEKPKGAGYANYWRILSFGARIEHALLILALCTAAGSGVVMPLMNIVFGNLVGNFTGFTGPNGGDPVDAFKRSVSRDSLFFVYLFIGKFILTYIGIFCFRTAGLRISARLRLAYLKALFSQSVQKLDEVSTGTVSSTITSSANDIQASISDRLSRLFQSLALVIAAYAVAFKYSWALTLAVSSSIVFVVISGSITTPPLLKLMQRIAKSDEKHATIASETVSSIRTVFAMGAEPKMIARHSVGVDASHKDMMKTARWFAVHLPPFFFATYAAYALAFWFGLKLYREGHISSVTSVIVVFFSVLLVTSVMGQIAQPFMDINKAVVASVGFFDMIDSDKAPTEGLKDPDVSAKEDIELKDVTFAYPTRPGVQVLQKFNATFKKGKTTALVGPSGSGKSTIVGLLERWYDLETTLPKAVVKTTEDRNSKAPPVQITEKDIETNYTENSGSIAVGGHKITDLDLKWWRSQIGLVQQEPFLFHDSIATNVAHGLIGTEWENAEETKKLELIKAACVEAFADEFIQKLPQGYSTKVGEGGIKLSGGQRQRIAIARSIVRNPSILILDEATSAIDVHSEKIVQKALDRAAQHRTTIMIAHRLSTVRKADHIIVLRSGQKIEEGTHNQLLSMENGLYSSLVRAQKIGDDDRPDDPPIGDLPDPKSHLTRTSTHQSLTQTDVDTTPTADEEKGILGVPYKKKGLFSSVGALVYESQASWLLFIALITAAAGCGAAYSIQSWLFAQLTVTFQYTGQRLIDSANFWSLMFFILALGVAACYAALTYSCAIVSAYVGTSCRRAYFSDALRMPIPYFDQDENTSGSVMSRITGDPKQIQDLLGPHSAFPMISVFNVVGSVIIAFYFGWKLTLVVFFAVMPIIIGASFVRLRYEIKFAEKNSEVFSASSQFATEATGAFRTVSSLGMEDVIIKRYDRLLSDQIKSSTKKASYALLIYAFSDSIELCGMALAFWYGGQLLASGEYSAFQFFVIYIAVVQGSQAAGQYLSIIPNLATATASANRILEMRSQVRGVTYSPVQPKALSDESGAEIKFDDVSFQYAGLSTPLFSHLNIKINAGQYVAFVGPSGCGKTTVISMLERFYDPVAGSISVDGENISTLDTRQYRSKLALVSQEPRLFSGTIKENLLLGVIDSEVTEEQMMQACRDAEIHDFIASLPDGYGTELGQNAGTALSGGQKQRVCLARALLRRPKLLLLDEATSSLDSQSEKLVQSAIERLAGQRSLTVIAVAHRLATIQKADVIFVFGERDTESMKGSRIVEKGSHRELFAKRGVYWSMCKAQALDQ